MYHYLETKDGHKVVDVEPYIRNGNFEFVGGVSYVKNFLNLYDSIPTNMHEEFKNDFNAIDEMRGWFFERYLPFELNYEVSDENLCKVHDTIKQWLQAIAKKYNLYYGEG